MQLHFMDFLFDWGFIGVEGGGGGGFDNISVIPKWFISTKCSLSVLNVFIFSSVTDNCPTLKQR